MITREEQAAILLEGLSLKILKCEDIRRWASQCVAEEEKPPKWIVDLSTLEKARLSVLADKILPHAKLPLPVHRKIQLIALACDFGFIPLATAIGHLFRVTILERTGQKLGPLEERLVEVVVEWNCQKDLRVIEPALREKFTGLFSEYLEDSSDVALTLPWLFPLPEEEALA